MNNVAVDVAIGLVFIFLLYSLLATIIQEIIARWIGLRARVLARALSRMLIDSKKPSGFNLWNYVRELGLSVVIILTGFKKGSLVDRFYNHESIKYLGENGWSKKPSYLKSDTFSTTLIDLLLGPNYDGTVPQRGLIETTLKTGVILDGVAEENPATPAGKLEKNIDPETLLHLNKLFIRANGDIDKFKALLEKWFDETMERCIGWYKKKTQFILFLIGLSMAIGFNIDTIKITKILAKDKTARDQMVKLAIDNYESYGEAIKQVDSIKHSGGSFPKDSIEIEQAKKNLKELKGLKDSLQADANKAQNILGFGWNDSWNCDSTCEKKLKNITKLYGLNKITCAQLVGETSKLKAQTIKNNPKEFTCSNVWAGLPGFLITALAISLGAPFWFDLLNKLMALRGSKKIETDSGDAKSSQKKAANDDLLNTVG